MLNYARISSMSSFLFFSFFTVVCHWWCLPSIFWCTSGITRLNDRARQDVAVLGLGFLKLDGITSYLNSMIYTWENSLIWIIIRGLAWYFEFLFHFLWCAYVNVAWKLVQGRTPRRLRLTLVWRKRLLTCTV